jgi:hypothetical protein
MKIGIMGLRPRQVADVAGRKFNGHELLFYSEKAYSPEHVASFVRRVDKVIIIQTGMPKSAISQVPYLKRHTMAGSISTVIRYLETIPCDTPKEEPIQPAPPPQPAKLEPTVAEVVQQATQLPPPAAPKELAVMLPPGYESQYAWTPDVAVIQMLPSGSHSYELLDAAVPGDVLRYARPEDVELSVWKTRIYTLRYQRQKKAHQLIEAHFFKHYVDLLVMHSKTESEAERKAVEAARAQKAAGTRQTTYRPKAEPPVKITVDTERQPTSENDPHWYLGEQAVQKLPVEAETPAVSEPTVPTDFTPTERGWWRQTFLAAMSSGKSADEAALASDRAVEHYRKRFVK